MYDWGKVKAYREKKREKRQKSAFRRFVVMGGVAGVVVIFFVYVYLSYVLRTKEYNTIFPLTRTEAMRDDNIHLLVQLPSSAKDIYFYFSDPNLFSFDYLLRFRAARRQCLAYAESLMRRKKGMRRYWYMMRISRDAAGKKSSLQRKLVPVWDRSGEIRYGIAFIYRYPSAEWDSSSPHFPADYENISIDFENNILYFSRGD